MSLPEYVLHAIEQMDGDKEYHEELRDMELSVRMEIKKRDAAEWKRKTTGLKCGICGGDIHVERVISTQAIPKYCHKLSCKAAAKAKNTRDSKLRKKAERDAKQGS